MPNLVPTDAQAPGTARAGIGYVSGQFVADLCAPVVAVPKRRGYVPIFPRSAWARDEARPRPGGAHAVQINPNVTLTTEYRCEVYAAAFPSSAETLKNADFDLSKIGEMFVREKVALARERRVATMFFTSSNWDNSTTLSQALGQTWEQTQSSTPLDDVETGCTTVADAIGRWPNTIIFGRKPTRDFLAHPSVKEMRRGNPLPADQLFANYFRTPNVVFAEASYCTSAEGVAEASCTYAACWGNDAWVGYVELDDQRVENLAPSAVYTMRFPKAAVRVRQFTNDSGEVESVEAQATDDELVTSAAAGYLIVDASA